LLELELEIDIRTCLEKLPEGLGKAYSEIFEQIRKKPGSEPKTAHRAFQWIMCSEEPLRPEQLVAAVCQDPENDSFTEIYVDIGFVLKACNNLLVVDLQGICRFSHLSVQEYLEEKVWTISQANSYVAKICLMALNDSKLDQERAVFARLIRYMNKHWYKHVRKHSENVNDDRLSTLLEQFFGSMDESGPAYRRWHANCQSQQLPIRNFGELNPSSSSSFAVCLFGIFELLSSWWEAGFANVEQRNGEGTSLVQIAATEGSFAATKALIELGADANAQGRGRYGNALQAASAEGHDKTVELLLSKGADVNAQGGVCGNALQAASGGGHDKTVELLLSKGADVNAQGGGYGNALQAASHGGHDKTVELLLSKGADINAQERYYGNALQAASRGGHDKTVELLLSKGADVNAQGRRYYGNALQAASVRGHDKTVELLLSKGADVSAQGGRYGNALQAASAEGHDKIVELLLSKGANVNTQGRGYYGNALQAASGRGHDKIVELLLSKGADKATSV
jgi:ankyrin repeat protein